MGSNWPRTAAKSTYGQVVPPHCPLMGSQGPGPVSIGPLRGSGGRSGDRWGSLRTGKGHGEADTHNLPQVTPLALHSPLWDVSSRPMALVMTHKCRSQRGSSSSRALYPSSHWTLPLNIPKCTCSSSPQTQLLSSHLFFRFPFSLP